MSETEQTASSEATVPTDRPARYAKQLVSHLTRRATGDWDDEAGRGALTFDAGAAQLAVAEGGLWLRVEGPPEGLPRLEGVVGRHLVRFGQRDELVVRWQRSDGTPGSVQQFDGEAPAGRPEGRPEGRPGGRPEGRPEGRPGGRPEGRPES